jgi:pSer/pThr/pTyr-binding forkhead associated (FHA) protein
MVKQGQQVPLDVPVLLIDFGLPPESVGQFHTQAVSRKPAILLDDSVFASLGAGLFPVQKSGRNPYDAFVFIGRGTTSDIVLRHHSVSKSHAYLASTAQGWLLHDNRSRNGTFVDGQRLVAEEPMPLRGRVLLTFGTMQTYFLDPKALADLVK